MAGAGAALAYIQGDRRLKMLHCSTCGCVTHWESMEKEGTARIAANAWLMDPVEISGVRIRRFDGASSWTYQD